MHRTTTLVCFFTVVLCTTAVLYKGIKLYATSVHKRRDIQLDVLRREVSELEKPTHGRLKNNRDWNSVHAITDGPLNTKSSHVLWSRGWRDIVRCPSVPDSYFNAGTETRHSALKMLTYFQNCSGLIWIRLNTGQPSDIETFVNYVLPHMTKRFTLITTDGDNSVPSKITNYQALLNHPLLDAWFTQNYDGSVVHPKLYLFPIGFDLHTSRRDKKWRSFNGISIMKDVRNREFKRSMTIIFDKMRPNPYRTRAEKELTCIYKVKKKLNAETIWEFYSSHVFGISPRGNGLDCHRTWEMIYFGMIPIVKSSSLDPLYADLPVVIVKQWEDVCELDLNAVYESIRGKMPVRDDIFTLEWWLEKKTLYSDI